VNEWWCYQCGDWRGDVVCAICGQKGPFILPTGIPDSATTTDSPSHPRIDWTQIRAIADYVEPPLSALDADELDADELEARLEQIEAQLRVPFRRNWITELLTVSFGFGSTLAMVLSYNLNHSILWAIVHGVCSWGYVIYRLFAGLLA
jgi:hypothetical protein